MQLQFFGHAALKAKSSSGASLLCDPWFSRAGAFLGGWFQFPANSQLIDDAFEGVRDVVISHNHADHFDPETLRRFLETDSERRIHIAKFATSWFRRRAERFLVGFEDRIVEHRPWLSHRLAPDLSFYFVPEESPGQIDSAIVIESEGRIAINLNDARLDTAQFARMTARAEVVDALALQASGASEYPVNYLYDDADMRARSQHKRRLKFESCEKIIDQVAPNRVLFFAGPPVFLDPSLSALNEKSEHSVFPDQLEVVQHFTATRPDITEKTWFALPLDRLDDSRLWPQVNLSDPRWTPFTRKDEYIAGYRKDREEYLRDHWESEPLPPRDSLRTHFESMLKSSDWINKKIGGTLEFVVRGQGEEARYAVDFAKAEVREGSDKDALYVLTAPASSVAAILRGDATWDDLFLSMRMVFDERIESFVAHFKTHLKYLDADICRELEAFERSLSERAGGDTFRLDIGDRAYRVQRHCPHAGVDLETHGKMDENGVLVCTAHRFRFEIPSGRCLNVKNFKLEVRPIED